jgi:hypothetical protein
VTEGTERLALPERVGQHIAVNIAKLAELVPIPPLGSGAWQKHGNVLVMRGAPYHFR